MWPQYWGLYEPRGPAKGPKGVKSHPTKKNDHFLYVTSTLTRGWVCRLQLLLVSSAQLFSGPGPEGLMTTIRDSPNLKGQVTVFVSPRNRVAQLYPQALGSLFVDSTSCRAFDSFLDRFLFAYFQVHHLLSFYLSTLYNKFP
jgi:hypothetical protein